SESEKPDLEPLCAALVANVIAEGGEIISAHALFLFDAALQTEDANVIRRVANHLSDIGGVVTSTSTPHTPHPTPRPTPYNFARDYGACLKAHAVAKRLRARFPNADFEGMLAAVHRNLDAAPPSEEMAFA
ncbi:MAG TPA: hypothetical protein VNN25_13255, partial [Thermoanaerobaculia bacterium]|nr:hypothetical protein [Thermoanaerobaculia bacterium]